MNIEQALEQVERVASMRHSFSPQELQEAADRLRFAVGVYRTVIAENREAAYELPVLDQIANGYFP